MGKEEVGSWGATSQVCLVFYSAPNAVGRECELKDLTLP